MLTLIKVTSVALINFLYITLFKAKKIQKMSSDKSILEARKELKKLSQRVVKAAQIDLEVKYLDKRSYSDMKFEEGIVVISNHESNLDIPVLVTALDIPIGFIAKKEMESWPFYSLWMKLSGCIFLDRTNPREGIKSIRKAVDIVKQGYPMVIFPEGERTITGEMGVFKKGSFKLATETNGIILPITIDGTYNIQNRKSILMKPNQKVIITVGKPIYMKELSEESNKNINDVVQKLILNEKIQKNIKK